MAEAAVESRTDSKFYCHSCSTEINPKLPEFTCPQCENGFIEEITEETSENIPSNHPVDPAAQFAELWGRAFLESFQNSTRGTTTRDDSPSTGQDRTSDSDDEESDRPQPHGLRPQRLGPFTRISLRTGNNRARQPRVPPPYLHGLLQLFVDRLTGEMGQPVNFFPMHGNPGDYAWGVGGLDNIITQLLNQLEGSGPPPAEKGKIEALPTVTITQAQVEATLQCSVCMDDFELDTEVKKLPCDHHFHKDCIVPWLEMHGTCPVCRKDLNGQDSSLKNDDSLISEIENFSREQSHPTANSGNSNPE